MCHVMNITGGLQSVCFEILRNKHCYKEEKLMLRGGDGMAGCEGWWQLVKKKYQSEVER